MSDRPKYCHRCKAWHAPDDAGWSAGCVSEWPPPDAPKPSPLNPEQSAAVQSDAPVKLVLAGPGAGKTRVLVAAVEREAKARGAAGCVVVTYTNAAANELVRRLAELGVTGVGFCGTIHAFCYRLLCEHGELVGLPRTLTVLDDEQRRPVIESIMADMGSTAPWSWVELALHPKLGEADRGAVMTMSREMLVGREYYRTLKRNGVLDFDMILFYGLRAIQHLTIKNPIQQLQHDTAQVLRDSRELIGIPVFCHDWPYRALFVDEAQDATPDDWAIYDAMPCGRKMFVGDHDQGVFGFRGADPVELVRRAGSAMAQDSPAQVFTLETNYRCGMTICYAANALIAHNAMRIPKHTRAERLSEDIIVHSTESPEAEMQFVCIGAKVHQDSCAVLARTSTVAEAFSDYLRENGVPVAERRRDDPPDWRKAKLLLTVLANPWNDFAAYQYLIARDGKEKADDWKQRAAKLMEPVAAFHIYITRTAKEENPEANLIGENISSESRARIHAAYRTLSARGPWSLPDLILYLNAGEDRPETDGVFVGTVHSAKGREWQTVFVVGMEEGLFPLQRKDTDMEEERRLAFVAMTRAEDRLFLTWSRTRPQSRGEGRPPGPVEARQVSRFIEEAEL